MTCGPEEKEGIGIRDVFRRPSPSSPYSFRISHGSKSRSDPMVPLKESLPSLSP